LRNTDNTLLSVGGITHPVYFNNGIPVECGDSLDAGITGNAATATKFASAASVALTGDVTGSVSSQHGWSVATTLANSGVTAGNYGHSKTETIVSFTVPYITVDAKGRITSAKNNTITVPVPTLSSLGITATAAQINKLASVTATAEELNIVDELTATTTELNYCDGVTSNI
jgi:hypothetical protein